jgi:hypothetical protein
VEQATLLDTRSSSTASQLEARDNQFRALEKNLEIEHKLTVSMFEEMRTQLQQQRRQSNRIRLAAAVAFALVAVAAALLIRDV